MNLRKEIEKIVNHAIYETGNNVLVSAETGKDVLVSAYVDEIMELISKEILAMIGEDEKMIVPTNLAESELLNKLCINAITSFRNLLKQQIREKIINSIKNK